MKMKQVVLTAAITAASLNVAAVEVGGVVEYAVSNDNGVYDVKSNGSYLSFSSSEDLGNGVSAYAVMSADVDSEAGTQITSRDAHVGIKTNSAGVAIGRMPNVQKKLSDSTIDVFEGNTHTLTGAARADNVVTASVNVGPMTLIGSAIVEGTTGEDTTDAYEVGAFSDLGPVNGGVVYTKDQVTGASSKMIAGSATVAGAKVGASLERVGVIDTINVVASVDVGLNTVSVGYADIEGGSDTYTLEGVHKFSNAVSVYGNVQTVDTNANEVYQVGMKYAF